MNNTLGYLLLKIKKIKGKTFIVFPLIYLLIFLFYFLTMLYIMKVPLYSLRFYYHHHQCSLTLGIVSQSLVQ
nr:MAG TPA: hypothetical protein [Caudoviricetes sp.]DAY42202.1 MAG TPA: hypothetical protein [Caudoviricetes sp.]